MGRLQIQKPVPLREQVYGLILSSIRNGFYKPGDHLTEERVARDLGVSRTPVREALSQLDINRLLVARQNGGYQVRSLSVDEIAHIFEVRSLVEPYAIAHVTRSHSERDLQELENALQKEIKHAEDTNPDAFADANEEFRNILFDGLENNELKRCINQFNDSLQLIRLITLKDTQTRLIVIEGHSTLLEAISAHDVKNAKKAMLAHINNARKCVIDAMEKHHDVNKPQA